MNAKAKNFESHAVLNPTGTIIAFAGKVTSRKDGSKPKRGEDPNYEGVPQGWLLCDGRDSLKEKDYKALHECLLDYWGSSSAKKLKLPELNRRFLRGTDEGEKVGVYQADSIKKHIHKVKSITGGDTFKGGFQYKSNGYETDAHVKGSKNLAKTAKFTDTGKGTGKETRPINASVNWIIKT